MKIHSHNPVSASRPVNAPQPAARKADAREAGSASPTPNGHARLDAFASKVEKRLENALSNESLSPRQKAALEKERDDFHSLLARFESAYMDGAEGAKMDKADGMQKLLAHFSKSINHILAGGTPDAPKGTPTPIDPTGTTHGAGRGSIDLVG